MTHTFRLQSWTCSWFLGCRLGRIIIEGPPPTIMCL